MSARELSDWMDYWAVEPWGAWRDNLHAGMIAATVKNFSVRKLKRQAKPDDYMVRPHAEQQAGARGKLLSALKLLAANKGAKK